MAGLASFNMRDISGTLESGIVVIEPAGRNKHHAIIWKCKCHCGEIFTAPNDHLTRKKYPIKSCGCSQWKKGNQNKLWNGVGDISGGWWADRVTRSRGKRHEIPITISIKDGWDLFQNQNGTCALSGVPLKISDDNQINTASIDRIDSSKGYESGNIQFVHKDLNFMKNEFTQDYFVEICGSVYLKHKDVR